MLTVLDVLLFTTHCCIILFNLTGWIWKRTRPLHLITVAGTAISWFVLGIWKGWGYCFLTDWEWRIKTQLGETRLPNSFIHYLLERVFGLQVDAQLVDGCTAIGFGCCILLAILVNWVLPARVSPS